MLKLQAISTKWPERFCPCMSGLTFSTNQTRDSRSELRQARCASEYENVQVFGRYGLDCLCAPAARILGEFGNRRRERGAKFRRLSFHRGRAGDLHHAHALSSLSGHVSGRGVAEPREHKSVGARPDERNALLPQRLEGRNAAEGKWLPAIGESRFGGHAGASWSAQRRKAMPPAQLRCRRALAFVRARRDGQARRTAERNPPRRCHAKRGSRMASFICFGSREDQSNSANSDPAVGRNVHSGSTVHSGESP
jgi:hypothetical protein